MSAVGDAPSGRLTEASTPDVAGIREAVITTDGGVSLSSGDTRDAPATTAVSFIAETIATEGTVLPEAGTQTRAADTTTSSRSLDAQTAGAPAAADAVTKQTS